MRKVCTILLIALWLGLTAFAWLLPPGDASESERRPLAQFPEFNNETVTSGKFMSDFGTYTLDQFPLRDTFRRIKSLFHFYCLGQQDNNSIYLHDGYAAKQEYPLNETSLNHAMNRLNYVYDKYLSESRVYMAVVPDKGYYLAQPSGHLAMDYAALFHRVEEAMPWARHIDLTGSLSLGSYYRTDTHWRQEELLEAASVLCQALGIPSPHAEDYTPTPLERPFYGVYYGQAALPMDPETIYLMESELIAGCTVYDHETGKTLSVYDPEKLDSKDLYDVYLSGAKSLLTIENPNADTDRELIVFRDSFGSSMIPLLLQGYRTVTVVDIRYLNPDFIGSFVDFHGQDVLMLYSTLILNQSSTLQ